MTHRNAKFAMGREQVADVGPLTQTCAGGDSASEGESAMRSAPPPASGCELVGVKVRRLALPYDGEEVDATAAAEGPDPGSSDPRKPLSAEPEPEGRCGRAPLTDGLPAEETCMALRAGENAAADAYASDAEPDSKDE